MRRALATLTTRRLDGRSAIAVAVRRWKEDVRRDLGGDLRAQETLLELAAQSWVIVSSLEDWIARQPSLVTKKRGCWTSCCSASSWPRGSPAISIGSGLTGR